MKKRSQLALTGALLLAFALTSVLYRCSKGTTFAGQGASSKDASSHATTAPTGTPTVVPPADPCAGVKITAADTNQVKKILMYSPQGGGGPSPGAKALGLSLTSLGFEIQQVSKIENATAEPINVCNLFRTYGQIWMFLPCKDTPAVPSMTADSFAAVEGFYKAGGALVMFVDGNYGNAGAPHCTTWESHDFGNSNDIRNVSKLLGITLKSDLFNQTISHTFDAEILQHFNSGHGTNYTDLAKVVVESHPLSTWTAKLSNGWGHYITDAPKEFSYLSSMGHGPNGVFLPKLGVTGIIERPISKDLTQVAMVFASTFYYEGLPISGANAAEVFTEVAKYIRSKQPTPAQPGLGLTASAPVVLHPEDVYSNNPATAIAALKKYAASNLTVTQLWELFKNPSPLMQELAGNAACSTPKNRDEAASMLLGSLKKQISKKTMSAGLSRELLCAQALLAQNVVSSVKKDMTKTLAEYVQTPIVGLDKEDLLNTLFQYDKVAALAALDSSFPDALLKGKALLANHLHYELKSLTAVPPEVLEKINPWLFHELLDLLVD